MNTGGVDFWGRDYTVDNVAVAHGEVLPLWIAVVIPPNAAAGTYAGTATVTFKSNHTSGSATVGITLTVAGPFLPNGGDDDLDRGTRLHWFDSRLWEWG